MKLERDKHDGHIIIRFDHPLDDVYAEQLVNLDSGTYTTWLHLPNIKDAERLETIIGQELLNDYLTKDGR